MGYCVVLQCGYDNRIAATHRQAVRQSNQKDELKFEGGSFARKEIRALAAGTINTGASLATHLWLKR